MRYFKIITVFVVICASLLPSTFAGECLLTYVPFPHIEKIETPAVNVADNTQKINFNIEDIISSKRCLPLSSDIEYLATNSRSTKIAV